MNAERIDDYYDENDPSQCRLCLAFAEETSETIPCQFCNQEFATGGAYYHCTCTNEWRIRSQDPLSSDRNPVCPGCRHLEIGSCANCGNAVTGIQARGFGDVVVCNECLQSPEAIWCPACEATIQYRGYLKGAFYDDRASLHAAALVTHYRHEHVRSHDRAWQNPGYAATIPNYNYRARKDETNNRAKRQLIRAIAKHIKEGSYPETAPIQALELVRAFGQLLDNDEETEQLINATLNKFDGASSSLRH